MIKIYGQEFSEASIAVALEKHCGFEKKEKPKPYQFKAGDIAINKHNILRIITRYTDGIIFSMSMNGDIGSRSQVSFEEYDYRKIGELSDPKVIEFLKGLDIDK